MQEKEEVTNNYQKNNKFLKKINDFFFKSSLLYKNLLFYGNEELSYYCP